MVRKISVRRGQIRHLRALGSIAVGVCQGLLSVECGRVGNGMGKKSGLEGQYRRSPRRLGAWGLQHGDVVWQTQADFRRLIPSLPLLMRWPPYQHRYDNSMIISRVFGRKVGFTV